MNKDSIDNFKDITNEADKGKNEKDLSEYLMSKLSKDQTNELNRILKDEKALNDLLSSERAQNILKKLTGGKNG